MTKIVEMYRSCQYLSWEEAEKSGGMYTTIVHNDEAVPDVLEAITNACNMMDGNFSIETRVRDEYPAEIKAFSDAFVRCFGYRIATSQIVRAIDAYSTGEAYTDIDCGTVVIDAWLLWSEAKKYSDLPIALRPC